MKTSETSLFELAKKLILEKIKIKIAYNPEIDSSIVLETDYYLEVRTSKKNTLELVKFDNVIFETTKADVMFEVVMFQINKEIEKSEKE